MFHHKKSMGINSRISIKITNNGYAVRCYSVKKGPIISIESVSINGIFLEKHQYGEP